MHMTNTCPFYNRFFFIGSRQKWRHRSWFPILIQRYIDHVAAGDLTYFPGRQIFGSHLNPNLHARSSNIVHFTIDRNNISNKSGGQEIKSLYPGSNYSGALTVLDRHNGSSLIDHTHNDATMHITMCIRIYQFHEPPGCAPRVGNTPSLRQIYFRKSSISIYYSLKWVHIAFITNPHLRIPLFSKMGRKQAFLMWGRGGVKPPTLLLSPLVLIAIPSLHEYTKASVDAINFAHAERARSPHCHTSSVDTCRLERR